MKKLTIIFITTFVLLALIVVYNYLYMSHKDIAQSDANFKVNSKEIFLNFTSNETAALAKYSNKVIETVGKATSIDLENKTIVLDSILFYQFDSSFSNEIKVDQTVKIKARLVGFDELMNEIKLDQSTILN
jgi:hypothetical protein